LENNVVLSILTKGSAVRKVLNECVSLKFTKERYTPYSVFRGSFVVSEELGEAFEVEVFVNNVLIHKGLVDSCEVKKMPSHSVLTVESRGHSFALGYNEMKSGIAYELNLEGVLTQGQAVPNVSYEKPTSSVGYLFIKTHSSLWDAVVNLCLKSENNYPYIAYPNMVRFTNHANPKTLQFSSLDEIVAVADGSDLSKIVSQINMKDTEDSYDNYFATSQFAVDRGVVRRKYIDFDRQWLADLNQGLVFRLNYSVRGSVFNSVTYRGFNGEDLNDLFEISAVGVEKPLQRISKIEIFGNKGGIFTKLTAYKDAYCNC